MSVEKTLEKLLRGESDANLRFEELCRLLQAKGISDVRVSGSHQHLHSTRRAGAHQSSTRGVKGQAVSSSTSPKNSGKLQTVMKLNYEMIVWWSTEDEAYVGTWRNCPAAWRTARRGRRPSKTPRTPSSSGSKTAKTTAWKFPSRAGDWCLPDFQPDDYVERRLGEGSAEMINMTTLRKPNPLGELPAESRHFMLESAFYERRTTKHCWSIKNTTSLSGEECWEKRSVLSFVKDMGKNRSFTFGRIKSRTASSSRITGARKAVWRKI